MAFPYKWPVWLLLRTFLKSLKNPQTPHKQRLALYLLLSSSQPQFTAWWFLWIFIVHHPPGAQHTGLITQRKHSMNVFYIRYCKVSSFYIAFLKSVLITLFQYFSRGTNMPSTKAAHVHSEGVVVSTVLDSGSTAQGSRPSGSLDHRTDWFWSLVLSLLM